MSICIRNSCWNCIGENKNLFFSEILHYARVGQVHSGHHFVMVFDILVNLFARGDGFLLVHVVSGAVFGMRNLQCSRMEQVADNEYGSDFV